MSILRTSFFLEQKYIYPCVEVARSDILLNYIKDIKGYLDSYLELYHKDQLCSSTSTQIGI